MTPGCGKKHRERGLCDSCYHAANNMIRAGKEYAHGRCYAAINGHKALLALPQEVTDMLTIADIGGRLMKALLKQRHAR